MPERPQLPEPEVRMHDLVCRLDNALRAASYVDQLRGDTPFMLRRVLSDQSVEEVGGYEKRPMLRGIGSIITTLICDLREAGPLGLELAIDTLKPYQK